MTGSNVDITDGHSALRRGLVITFAAAACLMVAACAVQRRPADFDPRTCLQLVPGSVRGLRITQGPRTEKSIIRDMVPAVCNGRALFQKMQAQDALLKPGSVVFRVVVEYTGEVRNVSVEETSITSAPFLSRVAAMIENTDFVLWARDDTDTVFFYPVRFRP